MRLTTTITLLAILAFTGAAGAAAEISRPLASYLTTAGADEFVPVTIIMDGGVAAEALADMTAGLNKDAARELVRDVARERAAEAQAEIKRFMTVAESRGMARKVSYIWAANAVAAEVRPALLGRVAGFEGVRRINLDKERYVACGLAWGVEKIGADRCWNELNVKGDGVVVAVTDTGCDYLHTDLVNRSWVNEGEIPDNGKDDEGNGFIDDYHGWNFNLDNNQTRGGDGGHGSHVAGTVAGDGTAGTQTGVAPGAFVMPVQVLSNGGSGTESDCWDGLQYAFDNNAAVTSMSLGWQQNWGPDRATWRGLIETLIAGGMVYSIAAGNERQYNYPPPTDIRTPGDVPAVITVGATDQSDVYTYFSSYGPVSWSNVPPYDDYPYPPGLTKPDVCAPGLTITSTRGISGGYLNMSGTSMATPHVAGFAALILSVDPNLTNEQVRDYMETYALDLGETGKDNDYGSGRVQCYETIVGMGATGMELASFTARPTGDGVQVRWTTDDEQLLAGFNLYRRPVWADKPAVADADALKSYKKLNRGLILGKSPYVFNDAEVRPGTRYQYLLEDVDLMGRTRTHGPVISRAGGNALPTSFWLAQSVPNPARDRAVVKFALAEGFAGRASLEVFDLSGRKVATLLDGNTAAGEREIAVDTSSWAPGVYVYRLNAGSFRATRRMVVAH